MSTATTPINPFYAASQRRATPAPARRIAQDGLRPPATGADHR